MAGKRTATGRKERGGEGGQRSYHHGDLRRAIMNAVLELVRERGLNGFTLSEAARRAGVSVAAPYRHFADRDAVITAAATEGFTTLADTLEKVVGAHADHPAALPEELSAAYVGFATASPARFILIFASGLDKSRDAQLQAAADRTYPPLLAAVTHLPADPEAAASRLWAIAHGVANLAVNDLLASHFATGEDAEAVVRSTVRDWATGLTVSPS
ncbi:TetR/AcrR family transcriptional regulator [Streptomyces sp. 549]|uniref:TetR/AcrR family transcriptional regulator n=1 Tax=Streptomyces sp. 549 TaxID=3049076 RepID=UPI0024C40B57|nr:TetR/AcrR family transcriptional regulator [Streptomyces sp. 549]MDK1474507.1 TetR/AcrR family transcriptional regulator [Streptomyces sp. 549]